VNQDTIRRDWAARGFSCDIWTDPPGQVWQDYVHAVDELLMLIDGAIELRFGGRVLQKSGTVYLIDRGSIKYTVPDLEVHQAQARLA
jgi:hypothetical protein